MARGGKSKTTAAPQPPDDRPVSARGAEFAAKRLTGNRAQRGCLPGGAPRWVYEVEWEGAWKNTYEPAALEVFPWLPRRTVTWRGVVLDVN